ncbi:DUF916 and DUF3324 domain-containing protein [Enterococcus casseliflavus]|nr:DUF916 and DUF3324 domain-containing protein [Enterococcus casseliflavus]
MVKIGWKSKTVILMLVSLILGSQSYSIAYAKKSENNTSNGSVGYSVQKIAPENEVNETSSFYDLAVIPGETKNIKAKLVNSTDKEIIIESKLYTASTNQNGEISYASQPDEFDDSLKIKLTDIAEVTASDVKSVVKPNSEKIVSVTIQVPKEVQDGVILGSWYFEKIGQDEASEEEKGIVIKNKYSYAMAIKLTVNKEIDTPNLNLMSVTTGLNNYRKVINGNVQNNQPAILSNLTITAQVLRKGQYDVLYENSAENMIMAPNSNFPFPVFLGEKQLQAGDYTMKMTAKTTDPKWDAKMWEWQQDFTIVSKEASELNEQAINDPNPPVPWWIYLIFIFGIVCIFALVLLLLFRKKE